VSGIPYVETDFEALLGALAARASLLGNGNMSSGDDI
jgi:hypothetical protein